MLRLLILRLRRINDTAAPSQKRKKAMTPATIPPMRPPWLFLWCTECDGFEEEGVLTVEPGVVVEARVGVEPRVVVELRVRVVLVEVDRNQLAT